ncbi:MAG: HYR domain-containing protein [Saprospiraceae bacterium]
MIQRHTPPAPGSGFSTDYIWSSTGKGAGHFSILNGAQVGSVNFPFWACVGKSGNPNTDYFMVVDGSSDITDIVWRESVSVLPSTEYSFSIWVNNIDRPIYNTTDPLIQIQITDPNGGIVAVSPPTSVPETPDEWVNICLHWIAPSNPSSFYRLEILTLAGIIGNDFALDCLSFKACMPPDPCSVSISVTPNPNKCGEVQVCAVSQNPAPVTFQWCDGRTDSCFTADQLPCDSVTYCVTITCSDGSTATAEVVYVVQDIVPPVINCPQDTTILGSLAPNGLCTAIYIPPGINATDNCDPNVVVTSIVPTVFSEGANTIVVTAMDRCGNVSTCSYEVTVYCDSCTCGTFSDLFIRPSAGPSIPVYCGQFTCYNYLSAQWPPLPLTGIFNCVGNCPDSTTVDYMLIQPDGNMISMTGVTASPNFAINVPQGMRIRPGFTV